MHAARGPGMEKPHPRTLTADPRAGLLLAPEHGLPGAGLRDDSLGFGPPEGGRYKNSDFWTSLPPHPPTLFAQVFILKMVRLSQKQVFASPFLPRSRLQLLVMVSVWFGRLAVPVPERRSGPRSKPVIGPNSGTRAETTGANRSVRERHRRSSWPTDIPDYSTVGTIGKLC
jgi:hypothetical protein